MPAHRRGPREGVYFRIPSDLDVQVRTLLANPMTGGIRYGSLGALLERLLREWVERQKIAKDVSA